MEKLETKNLLETALYYARAGWHIFPLRPAMKKPATENGLDNATDDLETIRSWWRFSPNSNIGLNCGASGLIVLDFDTEKPDYAGGEMLEQLLADYPTTTARSGSGGYHLYYSQPPDKPLRSSAKGMPTQVHVKGVGGYVVAAPSIHPDGPPYRWEIFPAEIAPQPLPQPIFEILSKANRAEHSKPRSPRKNYTFAQDILSATQYLQRLHSRRADDYESWLHVGMALSGLGEAGLHLWDEWSMQSNKYEPGVCAKKWPTFTPAEGLGIGSLHYWANEDDPTVHAQSNVHLTLPTQRQIEQSPSVVEADSEDTDEASDSHPLDVQTPPLTLGWIDEYAALMTKLTGSPREFNLVCGLATAATAIQRKARLRMSFADIYPNIYAAIVARSSVYHKSSALHKPRSLLQRAMLERLLLSELMTSEGLLAQLQNSSAGLVVRDEIGTLFDSHRVRYLRTLKPDLTALFDCQPYSRRLSNAEIKVDAPYLNILGATTPARFYDAITSTDWQDGFLARWLFVLPAGEPDFDATTSLYSERHDAEIGRLAVTLQNLDRQPDMDFALAEDAFHLWDSWQRQAAKDAYYFGDDTIAAVVTRYSAYALKFCILLAALNGTWGHISAETMQTAIHLADSFKGSVARLLREKDEHLVSGAQLQKVFKGIQILNSDGKGVTTKSLLQRTGMRKAQLSPCLDKLVEIGAIAYRKVGNGYRYWAMANDLPIRTWK